MVGSACHRCGIVATVPDGENHSCRQLLMRTIIAVRARAERIADDDGKVRSSRDPATHTNAMPNTRPPIDQIALTRERYAALGYTLLALSAKKGIDPLRPLLEALWSNRSDFDGPRRPAMGGIGFAATLREKQSQRPARVARHSPHPNACTPSLPIRKLIGSRQFGLPCLT